MMIDTYRRPAPLAPAIAPSVSIARARAATDTQVMGIHLAECRACQDRWFSLACAGEAVQRFFGSRVITTLVAAAAVWAAIVVLA